ncbi:ribosomal protein L11 methyltransferase-related [Abeliophyllum distichum]|uniref:ETFB lysine methyltransferase n=1 Tax=Abeliophyllum distichum TaxID=126358 RepID=A0ABD1UEU6_9LAMI
MSIVVTSFRGHFFKHLVSRSSSTIFSVRRRTSPKLFPFLFFSLTPTRTELHQQPRRRTFSTVNYSTPPSTTYSESTETSEGSFASPYLSVRISCRNNVCDVLSDALLCFGASSVTIDEQESDENDEIWIISIFTVSQDVKECISQAVDSVGLKEMPSYEVEMHDHTDWIKQTQESFHPVEVTEGLWIVPEWRKPPDVQAINIVLNPGLAFGTGEHPTTKLCLLLLQRLIKGGEYFLDYGTGSGILAIAAVKFGADLSVGFDIDSLAITSARQNAALNNIGPDKLLLSLVPSKNDHAFDSGYDARIITETNKYDVVIANILLYPLLDLAERIVSYAKPGAVVGVSGIISEQIPCVIEHYSQFLADITVSKMDDWACISGTKKRNPSIC